MVQAGSGFGKNQNDENDLENNVDISFVIGNENYNYTSIHNHENDSSIDYIPQIPSYIRTTSMVICITIMILGVIGNVMVPIVILKTKDMRNSTNIFLTNLSIADLLVLLVCTPTVLVEVNSKPDTWVLGHEMCKAVPFIELTVAHASVLTILAISFERYYAICEPLKAGYVCTKTRALLISLIAWAIAALFTSPILSIAKYDMETYVDGSEVAVCLTSVDTFWPAFYFIGTIFIFFAVPFLILLILYSIIAKHLMNNSGLITHGHRSNMVLKYRKQVIFMLGTVVLSFFICLLPFRALTLWIIIVPSETIMSLGVEGYYNILYFCRIMMYLNSAMNPILYNLMSTKFRDGFLKLLGCGMLLRKKRYPGTDRLGTFHTTSTNMSSSSSSRRDYWRNNSTSLRNTREDSLTSNNGFPVCGGGSIDENDKLNPLSFKDELFLMSRRGSWSSSDDEELKETAICRNGITNNTLASGSVIRRMSKKNFDDIKEESDDDDEPDLEVKVENLFYDNSENVFNERISDSDRAIKPIKDDENYCPPSSCHNQKNQNNTENRQKVIDAPRKYFPYINVNKMSSLLAETSATGNSNGITGQQLNSESELQSILSISKENREEKEIAVIIPSTL